MVRGFRDEDEKSAVVTFPAVVAGRETELALLCNIKGADHWVPKSQIDDSSEVYKAGDEGKLVVSAWCAAAVKANRVDE